MFSLPLELGFKSFSTIIIIIELSKKKNYKNLIWLIGLDQNGSSLNKSGTS